MSMFKGRVNAIHFVGIGGIGMSGIAELLLNLGYTVTGSDLRDSDTTRRLRELGGKVTIGHAAKNLAEADVVVISSAVARDNPEVAEALRRSIPVIPRAEMLAELMRLKYGIAIAGAHGKTTTTSLVGAILERAGLDPTVVIGGKVNSLGSNAHLGQSNYLVAEADESDGSFMKLSPIIAVVTNIDAEHLENYKSFEHLKETFASFVNKIPFYGLAVLCVDCEHVRSIVPRVERRFVTYGKSPEADYSLVDVRCDGLTVSGAAIRKGPGARRTPLRLEMVGEHNLLNAVAALAVADELGVPAEISQTALAHFGGVQRRFTIRGERAGIMVVDDYGHHPTEIRATLAGARAAFKRRIVAVFQPHRFSRVQALHEQFACAFVDADVVLVAPIYPAGEAPIAGLSGENLGAEIKRHGGHPDVTAFASLDALSRALRSRVQPGDIVISLGAGDVWKVGQDLLELGTGSLL